MDEATYAHVTKSAVDTILQLTKESRGKLDEDNQSHWDMALGVLRMWITVTGAHGQTVDAERLQGLIDAMPGVDDQGEGNWRASPVVSFPGI